MSVMVTVYRFKVRDQSADEWVVQLSKATEARIRLIGGRIIEGSAEEVPASAIDEDGYYRAPLR